MKAICLPLLWQDLPVTLLNEQAKFKQGFMVVGRRIPFVLMWAKGKQKVFSAQRLLTGQKTCPLLLPRHVTR